MTRPHNTSSTRPPRSVRGLALCALLLLTLLSPITPAPAQVVPAPITQTDMFSRGSVPPQTQDIDVTHNGIPVAYTPSPWSPAQGAFTTNQTVIPGNPGVVTTVFQLALRVAGSFFDYDLATITITTNTTTGQVTATGTVSGVTTPGAGPGLPGLPGVPGIPVFGAPTPGVLGSIATLTVDTATATAPITPAGVFTVTTIGDVVDRTVNSCVAFTTGIRLCTSVFGLNTTPVPPPPTATAVQARDLAQDEAFENNYVGAIKMMTEHISNIMLYQMQILGALLDSKHQLETQRYFGEVAAKSHKDYQPNEQVCSFATLARSTAASGFRVSDNISVLNTLMQKRELLNASAASAWGPFSDSISRTERYKNVYCDPNDNNGVVGTSGLCVAPASVRRNKDIDYRRTMSDRLTLDIDFTDAVVTPDEEDILALSHNLYNNLVISAVPETAFPPNQVALSPENCPGCRELRNARSLSAVRSVQRDSFASITAMKVPGSGLNAAQLQRVMENLGVPAADVTALVGTNPSYFAQMEIIGQKIYQDPNFYTNLYTSPANVARMKVVLQAIRLMVDRDKFEQALRREMLVSMMLEMRLRETQAAVDNEAINAVRGAK